MEEGERFASTEKCIRHSVCTRRKDTLCLRLSVLDSIAFPRCVRLQLQFTLHSAVKISDGLLDHVAIRIYNRALRNGSPLKTDLPLESVLRVKHRGEAAGFRERKHSLNISLFLTVRHFADSRLCE